MEDKSKSLKKSSIFSNFSDSELECISKYFNRKVFSDKAIIFKENSQGKEFYLIEAGTVAITKQVKEGTDTVIARLVCGDCFGELTMFDDFCRTASARAQEKSSLLVISHDDLLNMLEKDSKMAAKFFFALLKILSHRIKQTNQALKEAIIWGFEAMGYGD